MSFPIGPVNNQTATVNGITYIYSSANNAWTRVTATNLTLAGNLTTGGNVTIAGNLTVQGNTTTLNTETLTIEDLNITVANGAVNAAAADGAGLTVGGANARLLYKSATDSWVFDRGVFASGNLVANSGTVSSSVTSGALVVTGGAGISGALHIQHTGDVSANIGTLFTGNNVTNANLGAFQTFSNANAATQAISITSITTNANANTAAYLLTATGNINAGNITTSGTSGNISGVNYIFAGNYVYANGVSILTGIGGTYSNTNVAAYLTLGANIGSGSTTGNLVAAATTTSTSTTTGALVVKGGAGIAGDVNVGTSLTVDSGTYGNVVTTQFASVFGRAVGPNATSLMQVKANDGTTGMGMRVVTGSTTLIYSSGIIDFSTGVTVRDLDVPTGIAAGTGVRIAANGAVIALTGIASTTTGTGAVIVSGGVGVSGNLNVGNYANIVITTGAETNRSALTIAGNIYGRGGAGYLDAIQLTNNYSAATNPNKYIRASSDGQLQIINSAYTTNIFNLTDGGNLSIPGSYSVNFKKAVNGPAFSAYADSTLQTITSGSQQKVLFQTEEFDTDGCYASSRFTPTVEGYYQLNAEVRLDGSSGTGEIMIVLYKNTSEHKRGTNQSGTSIATDFFAMQVSSVVYANGTTDYFEIKVQQTSGGSMTVTAVNNSAITWFNGAMVRGA